MLLDENNSGGRPKKKWPPEDMWSSEVEPHKTACKDLCIGECKDIAFGNGEQCNYCDYTPQV